MQNLVKGLLDYTRIGKERELSSVDCKLLIYQILTDIQLSIIESDALITVKELPIINAFAIELRLLFQNLISNALKFRRRNRT
jgi:light-regulated signal transduction histidine kinase (bacteriophytochrome)